MKISFWVLLALSYISAIIGLIRDCGLQQRNVFFHRRMVILSIRCLLLYPFLWVLTIYKTMSFIRERHSSDEPPFIILWLNLNFTILCCNPCLWVRKHEGKHTYELIQGFLFHNTGLISLVSEGKGRVEFSGYPHVFVDMIREPEWEFEAAGLTKSSLAQTAATKLAVVYLNPDERRQVMLEVPKIRLEVVPTYCTACPICLEEFRVGNEVCGFPVAHYLHAKCVHYMVPGNASCPWCGRSVFPMIDLSVLDLRDDTGTEQEQQQPSVGAQPRYSRFLRSTVI